MYGVRELCYFFYQTLIGFWPDRQPKNKKVFKMRLSEYMLKAVREAKDHTDWVDGNPKYEMDLLNFIDGVLERKSFWESFMPFHKEVSLYGMYNSLSSLLLKLGMPGVVDFYQGEEKWRYDLVDPDNRREVDFGAREKLLGSLKNPEKNLYKWYQMPHDSKLKMYIMKRGLEIRNQEKDLFLHGEYIPLQTRNKNVVAFMRKRGSKKAIIAVWRFFSQTPDMPIWPEEEGCIDIFSNQPTSCLPFTIRVVSD